jgi:glucokinase
MLLAGDLGGTKTLLGLYEPDAVRPVPVDVREFTTLDYGGLGPMVDDFLSGVQTPRTEIDATVIGVAGPVIDQEAVLTNVPWRVSARAVGARAHLGSVVLVNDVEAMAYAVDALAPDEQVTLHDVARERAGNAALVAIGTGVGMAVLHRVNGRFVPLPSEGGHADFAARTEREIALLRALRPRYGRVDIERVVSGPGLANVARVTHGGACPRFPEGLATQDEPAQVTRAAFDGTCLMCREALDIFVEVLGAVAGNLALTASSTGGLFIGGGVPAKILPALQTPRFVSAFLAKAPVEALVRKTRVSVITLDTAGLLGAAVRASQLVRRAS